MVARSLSGTGQVNLGQGAVITVQGVGASLSPALGGWIAQWIGYEATFLLLTTLALLCAVRALRGSSAQRFGLCGLFCGLSYLTRPEGALLLASTALVLVAMQALPAWRRNS